MAKEESWVFVKLGYVGSKEEEWYHTVSAGGARHMADIGGNHAGRFFAKAWFDPVL